MLGAYRGYTGGLQGVTEGLRSLHGGIAGLQAWPLRVGTCAADAVKMLVTN